MKCPKCDGRGAVQIAPNVKGLKRCPVCGGSGKITEYDGLRKFWCDYKCEVCDGTGEVMTEQEYLQTCNTEQLAEELLAWWFDGANTYSQFGLFKWEIDEAKEKIVEWLKQPHTNEVGK